jgi:hypothetical protein
MPLNIEKAVPMPVLSKAEGPMSGSDFKLHRLRRWPVAKLPESKRLLSCHRFERLNLEGRESNPVPLCATYATAIPCRVTD